MKSSLFQFYFLDLGSTAVGIDGGKKIFGKILSGTIVAYRCRVLY